MAETQLNRTVLYPAHKEAGARIVDFGGWDMPLNYGSQVKEHEAVRTASGMFDVSHMTVVDATGSGTEAFLRYLLANDVCRLKTDGQALYTGMLNHDGGVIDDLIVYRMQWGFRLVVNCATREKDLNWIAEQASPFDTEIKERPDLAMIAVQGPEALTRVRSVLTGLQNDIAALKPFHGFEDDGWFIARTGYTGEDGLEIMVPLKEALSFWSRLNDAGVTPCGLAARDTLRLEAGMNLYGSDMDESVSPLESAMGWTIAWAPEDRDFIGRQALLKQKEAGSFPRLTGLILEQKGIMRAHQKVIFDGQTECGEITSGTFSPTLGISVALARVPAGCPDTATVEIRGKQLKARLVKPPFVRNGKKVFEQSPANL